ncbi:MAG: protein kinase [Proteobacteria bacterium]|nr:protein kinase [Pseudomonadota bacterium]
MIECPKCHQECIEDAHFCGNCAAPLKPNDAQMLNSDDAFVGKCIDNKYYIEKKLAAGGMGVVYLARQKGVGQEVAIKKLHAYNYSDKVIVERFIDEARSYGRITHPNAVKLHDLLNVNGQICIIMEFVHGKTLTHYIEESYPFTMRQIVDISLQIADALGTVHQAGIIHRDLKTENIMLMETVSGRFSVKILDFGIAKMMDKPAGRTTQEGVIVGTPEFMSPEQCFGNPVDHRADIYSFGILMYVMVCGRLPFIADQALALLQMQVNTPVPAMTLPDGSKVPSGIEAIVLKCLEKDPKNRYQCFADVITDLTCCQEGRQISIAVAQAISPETDDNTTEPEAPQKQAATHDLAQQSTINTPKHAITADSTADNDSEISIHDEKSQTGPRFSAEFAFYLDEDRDVKFSLDAGEMTLDEDDGQSNDANPQDESSEDGFSLGDIQAFDCSLAELEPVHDRGGKSGAIGLTIAIIIIVALTLFVVMTRTGKLDLSEHGISLPAFLLPEKAEPVHMPQAFEPKDGIIPDESPAETADNNRDLVPLPAPVQAPEPAAPSEAVSRATLERGMHRTLLGHAQTMLQAGKTKDAQNMLQFMAPQKTAMQEAELTQFETLTALHQTFETIHAEAKKAASREKCDSITKLLEQIPEDAPGMRSEIETMATKCNRQMAAPPTML